MANENVQYLRVRVEVQALVSGPNGSEQKIETVYSKTFADGTGNEQVGAIFYNAARSLNATNEDLDLNGSSSYTDWKGANLDMNSVALVLVENLDTDTGDYLEISRPAANGVTGIFKAAGDAVIVQPGGLFLWIAPGPDKATVTGATADLINMLSADNSTYRILIAGDNT